MGRYLWPILIIVPSVLVAGLWWYRPQMLATARSKATLVGTSFAAEFKKGLARLADKGEDDSSEAVCPLPPEEERPPVLHDDDPDPASLTPAQRKEKYMALTAAAKARYTEVLSSTLKKSREGMEALQATQAYHAKVAEMKRLEKQYGAVDDRVTHARIELTALREAVQLANVRYKAWKEQHKDEVADPDSDPAYRDLVARSRFYAD